MPIICSVSLSTRRKCGSERSSPASPTLLLVDLVSMPPHTVRARRDGHVLAQAHRLADLADRHARAVMDHRRAQPGAVAAVFGVDVLDHLLAPLVLEIDVDVGRLAALLGDEAVEQQVAGRRVDRGDAEAEADRRVGRAAAPLAQDRRLARAGEVDDLLDGQEIGRDVELADQRQLVLELSCRLSSGTPSDSAILRLPRSAARDTVATLRPSGTLSLRILVAQLVEAEAEAHRPPRASPRWRAASGRTAGSSPAAT